MAKREIEADFHKLVYHPERVAEWQKKGDCFPIYVESGATNRCNHKCIFCALDQWVGTNKEDINREVMLFNLEDMAQNGVKSIMFAGEGEPLLHQDISLFVQTAKKNGLDVSITSNGSLYNQKKAEETLPYLSWIRFSLDAGTSKTHSELHGVREKEFERITANIRYAVDLRNKNDYPAVIGIQALLLSKNAGEIMELARRAKEIGADNIQIKPYSHHPLSGNDLTVDYSKIQDLQEQLESLANEKFQVAFRARTIHRLCAERDYQECLGLPFMALIDSRGNVIPCNLFYDAPEFTYGNLYEQSFSKIWASQKRKEVLENIRKKGIDECRKGCRLDPANRYLYRLKNPHQHDNFI